MKKLFLITAAVFSLFLTGCGMRTNVSAEGITTGKELCGKSELVLISNEERYRDGSTEYRAICSNNAVIFFRIKE